ncbi:hypothetical protein AVEN_82389-1 [Araneus ventricosus]|uniref:Uncharacterized protein n=1 Tax=Araneus ventricosus TaxID=182803 RepID=A0A4Y2R8H9_ARAVE|nr:hypothetical protein AVEN_82389-1 [Araneus ventricosus]
MVHRRDLSQMDDDQNLDEDGLRHLKGNPHESLVISNTPGNLEKEMARVPRHYLTPKPRCPPVVSSTPTDLTNQTKVENRRSEFRNWRYSNCLVESIRLTPSSTD